MSAPDIYDIQTSTGGLYALLRCIYEVSTGIQFHLPDGRRDEVAEELSHLIILARDEAGRIDRAVDECIEARAARTAGGQ